MHTPVTAFKGAISTLCALRFELSPSCSWQQLCKAQPMRGIPSLDRCPWKGPQDRPADIRCCSTSSCTHLFNHWP